MFALPLFVSIRQTFALAFADQAPAEMGVLNAQISGGSGPSGPACVSSFEISASHFPHVSHNYEGLSNIICTLLWDRYPLGMPKRSGLMNARERTICLRFREIRERIKWPQKDFAGEIGLSRDKLASIEYGRTPLRFDVAAEVCLKFDVNIKWLASGDGQPHPYWPILRKVDRSSFDSADLLSVVCDQFPDSFDPPVTLGDLEPDELGPDFDCENWLNRRVRSWLIATKFVGDDAARRFALAIDKFAWATARAMVAKGQATKRTHYEWQKSVEAKKSA